MRVAVVTPYYKESPAILRRAHESVREQSWPCRHILVADGHPQADAEGWEADHLVLPRAHGDNGNTPRHRGAVLARERGYDAVAFLDADNWYEPDHIATLVALHRETGAPVVSSRRRIWSLDGQLLLPEGEAADGAGHTDTSALLVTAAAFGLLDLWRDMPRRFSPMCDTVFFYAALFRELPHAWSPAVTWNFQSHYKDHYFRALVPAPHDNSVENTFHASYRAFIEAPADAMAAVYLGTDPAALPPRELGRRMAAFGATLTARDKSGDALKYLRRGAELLEGDPAAANNLGAALARRHLLPEAEEWLRRASGGTTGDGPARTAILHNLGLVRAMRGQGADGAALLAEAAGLRDRAPQGAMESLRPISYGFLVILPQAGP